MRSHQGALKVWSEPGEGTQIEFFFPVAAPEAKGSVERRSEELQLKPFPPRVLEKILQEVLGVQTNLFERGERS